MGEDPASEVYVRSKGKQTLEAGMASFEYRLEAGLIREYWRAYDRLDLYDG